jgi:hypothetical protein
MKKALLSALIVVAIYLIINVSLYIWVNKDPSASEGGGVGWYYILFLIWGTPIFLAIAVRVFIKNYDLHRNPYSPLALTIKTKAFQYARKISLLFLVIVIIIEFLLNVAYIYYPAWGLSGGQFVFGYIVLYILGFIAYLVGSKEDKKNTNSSDQYSALALKSALVVVAIYLIILVLLYIGVNIDLAEFEGTVGLGSLFAIFLFGGAPIFLVLALIVPLIVLVVGSIKDKKNRNSTTSK